MKKALSAVLASILLLAFMISCFIVPASAAGNDIIKATDEKLTVDGIKEESYKYGAIFSSSRTDKPDITDGTSFEASLVWDGAGKLYCFAEVKDSDIVANDTLWSTKWWHCDSFQAYFDYGALGASAVNDGKGRVLTFVAEATKKYVNDPTASSIDWKVVITSTGYNVEFSIDNSGKNFAANDKIGFGPFLNACKEYTDASLGNGKGYQKGTVSVAFPNSADSEIYQAPAAKNYDVLTFSATKIALPKVEEPKEDDSSETNDSPKTGDSAYVAIIAVVSALGMAVVLNAKKRIHD